MLFRYVLRLWNCSQLDKHNSKENNDIPRDKSRCNAPPDWLKTTIARIVPSLQLAQTEPLLHLTPYSYTFRARSRIFSHTPFFARHYSLPPRQPSVFARLARWQLACWRGVWNHFSFPSCSQEGRDFGDEYLAELDHIGEWSVFNPRPNIRVQSSLIQIPKNWLKSFNFLSIALYALRYGLPVVKLQQRSCIN